MLGDTHATQSYCVHTWTHACSHVCPPPPPPPPEPIKRSWFAVLVDHIRWSRWIAIVRRWRRVQAGLDWRRDYRWSLECGRFRGSGWDSGERVAGFHRAWLETILFTLQITGSPPLLSDLDTLCEMEHEGQREGGGGGRDEREIERKREREKER